MGVAFGVRLLRAGRSSPGMLLAAALAACSGAPVSSGGPGGPGAELTASSAAPIIGGGAAAGADGAVVMVETLVDGGTGYECPGTLLAGTLVVPARHCVSLLVDETHPFACDRDGTVVKGDATLGP